MEATFVTESEQAILSFTSSDSIAPSMQELLKEWEIAFNFDDRNRRFSTDEDNAEVLLAAALITAICEKELELLKSVATAGGFREKDIQTACAFSLNLELLKEEVDSLLDEALRWELPDAFRECFEDADTAINTVPASSSESSSEGVERPSDVLSEATFEEGVLTLTCSVEQREFVQDTANTIEELLRSWGIAAEVDSQDDVFKISTNDAEALRSAALMVGLCHKEPKLIESVGTEAGLSPENIEKARVLSETLYPSETANLLIQATDWDLPEEFIEVLFVDGNKNFVSPPKRSIAYYAARGIDVNDRTHINRHEKIVLRLVDLLADINTAFRHCIAINPKISQILLQHTTKKYKELNLEEPD